MLRWMRMAIGVGIQKKPMIHKCMACWVPAIASEGRLLSAMFNIAKADTDWTESLQRIYKK